jgi:thiamine-phosphate pyrophosphorylase
MSGSERMPAGGVYLVVDPAPDRDVVLPKVEAALRGGVAVIQIWNHWAPDQDRTAFAAAVIEAARAHAVPVLVHEDVELLRCTHAHGIHYDTPALTPDQVRTRVARTDVLYGITCGNDLERVRQAIAEGVDYISFCSMFPSQSVQTCELVTLETLRAARALRDQQRPDLRIFASGGITPGNAAQVLRAGADGVAVVSGILGAADPEMAAARYAGAFDAVGSGR